MNTDLGKLPRKQRGPTAELLILALPIIGMMVTRMAMGFIDFAMVSTLGTDAQAAISPATLFLFAIACVGMGIAHGVQTFVSQADGRGEPERAGAYVWQSLYIAGATCIVSIPLIFTTDLWYGWIARVGGHSAGVTELEITYVRVALWCVAPTVACVGLNSFFSGIQKPHVTLIAVLASLGVNAFGNWLLIFGNLGFPKMGIAGAAVATVIGWFVRAGIMLLAMLQSKYDERYSTRHSYAFSWPMIKDLLRIGGPTSVQWLVDIGSWTAFIVLIMPAYGTAAMAAANIGFQYLHFAFMPAVGVGIALCSQVGFAIGEGRPDRARERTNIAMVVTAAYMGTAALIFRFAGSPMIRLFNDDPEVIQAGVQILIWAAVFQVFDAMCITFMNALRGAGDTRAPAIATAILCWGVFIGGGKLVAELRPDWGVNGPWAMCTLYVVALGLWVARRWRSERWREIRVFDPAGVPTSNIVDDGESLADVPLPAETAVAHTLVERPVTAD